MIERHFADMPNRIAALPRDERGFPIPKFVHWFETGPDFRVISPKHMADCISHDLCWICGGKLGAYKAFVLGPMCCINRISAEPPSHRDCAEFAAKNCPFLATPLARRREKQLPEHRYVPGVMLARNPGVAAVWITRSYKTFTPHNGGVLFAVGDPLEFSFYAEGRPATRAEVDKSIEGGRPFLIEQATKDGTLADMCLAEKLFGRMLDKVLPR